MKKRTLIAGTILSLAAGYTALVAYSLSKQDIESLLICADKGGLKIPLVKENLCRSYLFSFRGNKEDIETLQAGIGASWVVQGESSIPDREQVLKFLISRGLDVNKINMHQVTPLHAAVLDNSTEEIELLLRNGANVYVKDKRFGLSPLEFALKLEKDGKVKMDRSAVISLLRDAKSPATPANLTQP